MYYRLQRILSYMEFLLIPSFLIQYGNDSQKNIVLEINNNNIYNNALKN